MDFKQELIKRIKTHPDIFNEIRVETMVDKVDNLISEQQISYVNDPNEDFTLEELEDEQLIDSILRNLQYYIEYEKEMGESDL
ncbi:hypothetical protein [Orenia marismortui]|uniref:Uncharacterized protein n=1 Tax=Orenia marismortui TaxID=46469 RepID=A0A4V3GYA9_9FIRM|nr:hypothetical protein [Orenia marismortui]TDX51373.1 hypothetical protein C7959_11318 [Orenia marismortui]